MFCAGCPGHKTKIGELYGSAIVCNRDIFSLEIEDRLVFLVVNHQVERDLIDVRNNRGALSLCCWRRLRGRGLSVTRRDEKNESKQRNHP